jgi:formylglycine-generating enzyme
MTEDDFLDALLRAPGDVALRLVFADWLEERGDPRGELLRLTHLLTRAEEPPGRTALEQRLRALVEAGVAAVGPFVTNSVRMRFAWVPPGTFRMGSPPNEEGRHDDETPHRVTLTKGFFMGVHEVTQGQWRAVRGKGRRPRNPSRPAEDVSWDLCQELLAELSRREGKRYTLPTEAEWEYACRAGTTTPFHCGETIRPDQADYDTNFKYGAGVTKRNTRQTPMPVGSYPPNAFGLHDMHGNLCEWCQDWYGPYPEEDVTDPAGPPQGERRVHRGGCWGAVPSYCRAAKRGRAEPNLSSQLRGFRAVLRPV